jgi:hypothetical protein
VKIYRVFLLFNMPEGCAVRHVDMVASDPEQALDLVSARTVRRIACGLPTDNVRAVNVVRLVGAEGAGRRLVRECFERVQARRAFASVRVPDALPEILR